MKTFFLLLLSCLSPLLATPVLEPTDPQYQWMDTLIARDFAKTKPFSSQTYKAAVALHKSNAWIVRFRVVNNRVVEGPESPCRNLLEYLCQTYGLPNLDFLYWNQDGPHAHLQGKVPVLVGCRTVGCSNTILFSDYIFDIKDPTSIWNHYRAVIDALTPVAWEDRIEKAYWRGAGSDVWSAGQYSVENWHKHARGSACWLSLSFPEDIDAMFTYFPYFFCEGGDVEGQEREKRRLESVVPLSRSVSIPEHLAYKYQLQITGWMGDIQRERWQLYSNSVVFIHPSPHELYWYSLIQPWVHYIPVDTYMNDLVKKVEWARAHDTACRQIARQAKEFAETHFMPEHIALYCYKVLVRYAALQHFDPASYK